MSEAHRDDPHRDRAGHDTGHTGHDDTGDDTGHDTGHDGVADGKRGTMAQDTTEETRSALSAAFSAVTEVLVVVAMALAISLVVKTFLVQAFFIPSGSMENTLLQDDRVVVSKLTPGPFDLNRGDIIVFKDPGGWLPPPLQPDDGPVRAAVREVFTFVGLLPHDSGEHLIKRVVGLPGDTVVCCDAAGRVSVNGTPIVEMYLFPGNVPSQRPFNRTVPAGQLWVMGDHRDISEDSRVHGFVPESQVVGRAFVLVWPLSRAEGLGRPESAFAGVPAPAAAP